jgi:uncharacterized membrane protein YgcG
VRVAFGGVWKESLTELSGGQRSLLALSLVLALCRFKPAPIYILDEVDAALDLNHTQARAREAGGRRGRRVCACASMCVLGGAWVRVRACKPLRSRAPVVDPPPNPPTHPLTRPPAHTQTLHPFKSCHPATRHALQNIGSMIKRHFPESQFVVVSLKEGMFNNASVLFRTRFVDGVSAVQRFEGGAGGGGGGGGENAAAGGGGARGKAGGGGARARQALRESNAA